MIQVKFSKTFDEVLEQAYRFHAEFLTDETAFTAASPTFADPFAEDFLDDIQAADNLPTFSDDRDDSILYTQNVEEKMEAGRQLFQKLMYYVDLAYPGDNGIARGFGSAQYEKARRSTLKLIDLLQKAHKKANSTTYKAALISKGFLQTDITMLLTLADDIKTKNTEQEEYLTDTFQRTEARAVAFNKVWETMSHISGASKFVFKNSPAKIEFYMLYHGTGNGGGGVPDTPPVAPELGKNSTGLFFSEVPTATSYQLMYKLTTDTEWDEMYNGPYTEDIQPYPPEVGAYTSRVRARNAAGYGDWSPELSFTVGLQPTVITSVIYNPATHIITVQWSSVPDASNYDVYESVVALNDPPGAFTMLVPTIYGLVYESAELSVFNQTHHFYVITRNGTQSSTLSNTVPVNVPNPV